MKKSFKKVLSALLVAVMLLLTGIPAVNLTLTASAATAKYMWPVLGSYGISRWNSSTHYGVDINNSGNEKNPQIISTYSGTVTSVNNNCSCTGKNVKYYDSDGNYIGMVTCTTHKSTYGNSVYIANDDGTVSVYGHLLHDSIQVSVGSRVSQGQIIGRMGDSGVSTGIHLHFEIRTGSTQSSCIDLKNTSFLPANSDIISEPPSPVYNIHSEKKVYNSSEYINFTWDRSNGANDYWVYLWKDGVQLFQYDCGNNNSFTQAPSSTGNYTFIVRPGNEYGFNDNSEWYSFVITNDIPNAVQNLKSDKQEYTTEDSICFKWDEAYGTQNYWVYLWKDGVQLFSYNCGDNTSFTQAPSSPGNYTLYIRPENVNGFNESSEAYKFIVKDKSTNNYIVSYNTNGSTGSIPNQTKTHGVNLTLSTTKPIGKTFTVSYNANGGNVSPASKTVSQSFVNWNTEANGSGKAYSAGATYSDNASVTLYAQYSDPSIGSLPTPTRSGYTFDGWYTSASDGTKITDSTKVSTNTTLYAHWTKIAEAKATVKAVGIEHNVTINYKSNYVLTPEIVADPEAEYTVEYKSSDDSVVKVDQNGKLYGAKKGNATITCTVTDSFGNVVTDECNVNIDYSTGQWMIIIFLFGWIWYI